MDQAIQNRLRQTQIEILEKIVEICQKYDLQYYLVAGTLIGVVRHKGFIPWDDDVDIAMPRGDYEKFAKACETELGEEFFLHDKNSDEKYWWAFPKLRKNNTVFLEKISQSVETHHGIWVDIFLLDEAKSSDSLRVRFQSRVSVYARIITAARSGLHKSVPGFFTKILYFLTRPFSVNTLCKWRDKVLSSDNGKPGVKYYINFGSKYGYKKQTYLISDYYPPKKGEFSGKFYNIPNEYEKILLSLYGKNYMQLPPEEKRVTHNPVKIEFDVK